jgi:hypothetical protein
VIFPGIKVAAHHREETVRQTGQTLQLFLSIFLLTKVLYVLFQQLHLWLTVSNQVGQKELVFFLFLVGSHGLKARSSQSQVNTFLKMTSLDVLCHHILAIAGAVSPCFHEM